MKFTNYLLLCSLASYGSIALGKTVVRINPLGESSKGQYIAYEEYGYLGNSNQPFVKLKIMNVWKNKYVEDFKLMGDDADSLEEIRKKIKNDYENLFAKYSIIPIKGQEAFN